MTHMYGIWSRSPSNARDRPNLSKKYGSMGVLSTSLDPGWVMAMEASPHGSDEVPPDLHTSSWRLWPGRFRHPNLVKFIVKQTESCLSCLAQYLWYGERERERYGAARFPGPPNLHDLQNWFKQLILQLPICICIVQHVTWEISLPSFIETVHWVRSAPHRSFTLHKVFQRLVKENKEK